MYSQKTFKNNNNRNSPQNFSPLLSKIGTKNQIHIRSILKNSKKKKKKKSK